MSYCKVIIHIKQTLIIFMRQGIQQTRVLIGERPQIAQLFMVYIFYKFFFSLIYYFQCNCRRYDIHIIPVKANFK